MSPLISGAATNRRGALKGWFALASTLALGRVATASAAVNPADSQAGAAWVRWRASVSGVPRKELPPGKRLPRGLTAWQLDDPAANPLWTWRRPDNLRTIRLGRLRLTAALDFREERKVEAVLAKSGESLGFFDLRYAYALQPFEIILSGAQSSAVLTEGVILRAGGGKLPLWIVADYSGDADRQLLLPHLLLEFEMADPLSSFLSATTSLNSLQPFGWLEGCVLDGLQDLAGLCGMTGAQTALDRHIRQYVNDDGTLVHEDLRGQPVDGRFPGIESTLPMGAIAAQRPGHPLIDEVLKFWAAKRVGDIICDGKLATAEGSYTIGYPLAVIAVQRGQRDLAELALQQITERIRLLPEEGDLYLRCPLNGTGRTFRNWARAYAWYMLGLMRVWSTLHASPFRDLPGMEGVRKEAERIADRALHFIQPEGLWSCFLDRPETGIDTSGSAGIAAALAIGVNGGLLPESYRPVAEQALKALENYLTPDGILFGVAQHNAGGEALQSGGYRVLSQMGLGLMAQLYAAVHAERG